MKIEEVSHVQKQGGFTRGTLAGKQTYCSISSDPLVAQDRAALWESSRLPHFIPKKVYAKKELANLDLKMEDKGIW